MSDAMPIAVLVSGSGSNLQALIDVEDAAYSIVGVVSDRPNVRALDRADAAAIPTATLEYGAFDDRSAFTRAVCDQIDAFGAQAVVLAGFMRILGREAIERFPNAILNIHPSLLPAFPGAHAIEQALEAKVPETGVTVHLVDELVDHGPIIAQESVPVMPSDTADRLHARVQQVEHRLYPQVVSAFAEGSFSVIEDRVVWVESERTAEVAG